MEMIYREIKTTLRIGGASHLKCVPHIHDDIECVYVIKGGAVAFCDGRKYELPDNSFFMAYPNQVHHYEDREDGQYILLIVKPSCLLGFQETFANDLPISAVVCPQGEIGDEIAAMLKNILREWKRDSDLAVTYAYLTAMFGKLLKLYTMEKNTVASGAVTQVLRYCAEHYCEEISVNTVAQQLHMSRSSVSHIFSCRLSIHFCDYINALRLADAAQMLRHKSYSMTEIAEKSGFTTVRTFNRAFLKQYGMPPSTYRKMSKGVDRA